MKRKLLGFATVLVCFAFGLVACVTTMGERVVYVQQPPEVVAPALPAAEDEPFYADLSPYGEWVHVSGPGWVWYPYDTPSGWRPYLYGRWVYTDYGWTWSSEESFGWAVYHHGRWHSDPGYGWVWVPGTEWGPAWVAWHEGGGYVGWAPLPYQVGWRAGVGLDWGGVRVNVALGPSTWHFVHARDMVAPNLRHRIVPPSRNVTLIKVTQHVTNYTYIDNRIVDRSVKKEKIGRAVGHAIPSYRVRQVDSPDAARGGKVKGSDFVVFRPNRSRGQESERRADPPGHDRMHPRDGRGTEIAPPDQEPARRAVPPGHARQPRSQPRQEDPPEPPGQDRVHPSDEQSTEIAPPGQEPARRTVPPGRPRQPRNQPRQEDSPGAGPQDQPSERPSRTPRVEAGGEEGPQGARRPVAKDTPARPANPGTAASETPPGRDRTQGQGGQPRREGAGQSGNRDTVNAPSSPPASATAPGKPAPAGKPTGKPKGKKPGKPSANPETAKPEKPESEEKKSEDSKSENAESGG